MSSNVTGILSLVISGKILISTADKSVTMAANVLTIQDECSKFNSPIIIPVMAPIRAAPEQMPIDVVLKLKIIEIHFMEFQSEGYKAQHIFA